MSKKEITLKEGNIIAVAKKYKEEKQMKTYLDYVSELIDFQEEIDEYKKSIKDADKYVKDLLKRINDMSISKEEAGTNFVKYLKEYDLKEWSKLIARLK